MGMLDRMFSGIEKRVSLANPDAWLTTVLGGAQTDSGVLVDEDKALTLAAVWACHRVLAETLASLPLPVYRRLTPRGKERFPQHDLYEVLHDQPNREMTSFAFRETLMHHLVGWGNAYAEIEYDRAGRVIGLWPLLPDRTWPVRKNKVLSFMTRVNNRDIKLSADRVFHIHGLGFNGMVGYSPIAMHRESIGLGLAAQTFGARFFGSGAKPGGHLEYPGKFRSAEQKRDYARQFDEAQSGLTNAQRTLILDQGMEFKTTSIPPDDAQFLQTRDFQVRDIARIYRVQPHMIGDLKDATYANIEQESISFVVHTMRPWFVRWEQAIRRDLIRPQDQDRVFAEFLVDGLLRGDAAARFTSYNIARNGGWFSANDIRALENMNPLPGKSGDLYLVPLNMVPADQLLEDQAATPGGDGNTPPAAASARERRSLGARKRIQRSYAQLLKGAASRVVRRETQAIKQMAKTLREGGNSTAFLQAAGEFYADHPKYTGRQMHPVFVALATSIYAEAAGEINGSEDMDPTTEQVVEGYTVRMAARMATSSLGQLATIVRDAPADDVADSIDQRMDEWIERRPDKVAKRDQVQLGSAIAKAAWVANGVQRLVWRTGGDACPLCEELEGKIVEITRSFADPGDQIAPGGDTAPLEVTQSYGHPPLHEGCDCSVEPD